MGARYPRGQKLRRGPTNSASLSVDCRGLPRLLARVAQGWAAVSRSEGWPIWSRGHRVQEHRSMVATGTEGRRHTPGGRTPLRSEPLMAASVQKRGAPGWEGPKTDDVRGNERCSDRPLRRQGVARLWRILRGFSAPPSNRKYAVAVRHQISRSGSRKDRGSRIEREKDPPDLTEDNISRVHHGQRWREFCVPETRRPVCLPPYSR